MAADGCGFDTDTEQLAFHSVFHVSCILLGRKHRVERGFQAPTSRHAIYWRILVAIRDPDIGNTGATEFCTKPCGDITTPLAVFDPEVANAGIGV